MSDQPAVPPPGSQDAPAAGASPAAPQTAAPSGPGGVAVKPLIAYDDFAKIDLRVATVLSAEAHPNADKLLVLKLDLGGETRQVLAGIRAWYAPEALVGKQVVIVANLEPRKIRGLESNGMVLAASAVQGEGRDVIILMIDRPAPPGSTIS